ncbi:sodium:calcium antiporter [Candidatus Micrarchaeota archaeon]|nr:sodium:calcium antiporter [Candidatus Micrarchaeota archaeon]
MIDFLLITVFGIIGVALIIKGADWLTDSIAHLARAFAVSHAAIGLILVSALLSLPEIVVAISSILKGYPLIGLGTVLGSVIINLGLIVGASAMISDLKISKITQIRDLSFMLAATFIVSLLVVAEGELTRIDGLILVLIFVPYVLNVYQQERYISKKESVKEARDAQEALILVGKTGITLREHRGFAYFLAGAIMMIIGSMLFTDTLINYSKMFGISEMVIGITLGALGPSIPNLAAALQATRRGLTDLAVTETIGSNIFTMLISVGILSIMTPISIEPKVQLITIPALIFITLAFIFISRSGKITKKGGFVLLGIYLISVIAELLA